MTFWQYHERQAARRLKARRKLRRQINHLDWELRPKRDWSKLLLWAGLMLFCATTITALIAEGLLS